MKKSTTGKTIAKTTPNRKSYAIVALNKFGTFEWANGIDEDGKFLFGPRRLKGTTMGTREMKSIVDEERDEYGWEFFLDVLEDVKGIRPMSFIVTADTKLSALKSENIVTRVRGELSRIQSFYRKTAKTDAVDKDLLAVLNGAVRGLDKLSKAGVDVKTLGVDKTVTGDYTARLEFAAVPGVETDTHTATYAAVRLADIYTEMTKHDDLKSLIPAKAKWGIGAAKKVYGFNRAKYGRVINNRELTLDDIKGKPKPKAKAATKPKMKTLKSKEVPKVVRDFQATIGI